MELEKANPDVLGSLYTLRGGLSAISVEYDRARKLDDDKYKELQSVANSVGGAGNNAPDNTVEFGDWLIEGGIDKVIRNKLNSVKPNPVHDDRITTIENDIQSAKSGAAKRIALSVLFLLIAASITVGLAVLNLNNLISSSSGIFYFLLVIAIAAYILLIIFFVKGVILLKKLNKYNGNKHTILAEIKAKKEAENNRVESEKTKLQNYLKKLLRLREDAQNIINERNSELYPIVQSCNVFYRALSEQFTPILDERDWQHLDLVIYEIETRRADNVKEALQLVDRELQTERIERTIGEAANAICHTLQCGFTALQQSIKICCEKICDRLDTISSQLDTVSMQLTVQSFQLADISGQLADLTDSVNVNNALQAKANETSAQLCRDARALRSYS